MVAGADVEVEPVDAVDDVEPVEDVGAPVVVLRGGIVVVVVVAGPKSPIATATPPKNPLS